MSIFAISPLTYTAIQFLDILILYCILITTHLLNKNRPVYLPKLLISVAFFSVRTRSPPEILYQIKISNLYSYFAESLAGLFHRRPEAISRRFVVT